MQTQYHDASSGWTGIDKNIDEALRDLRDDGRFEITSDHAASGVRTVVATTEDGERFVLVGAE